MWLRNKKTGGLFNTDDIKGNYIRKLNDISKKEYENKIDKTEYDKEVRKATEDYKREKEEYEHNKMMLKEMERRLSHKNLTEEQIDRYENRARQYESAVNEYESKKEKKFKDEVMKMEQVRKDISQGKIEPVEKLKIANKDVSPMSEYSDTTGTGLSDKQHTALTNMSLSKMQTMAREYGVETKGLTKKQLMAKLITIFNK